MEMVLAILLRQYGLRLTEIRNNLVFAVKSEEKEGLGLKYLTYPDLEELDKFIDEMKKSYELLVSGNEIITRGK